MRATSSTLFIRVYTRVTKNAGMENARQSKSDTGKPETDTHYQIQRLTKTYDTYFPLSLKLSILHFSTNVVMLYTVLKNNTNNDIFTVFALQIKHRASVAPHINFPGSYSATGITNWVTQQTWLDCFFGFVSLAIQTIATYFLFPHFQSRVFQCRVFCSRAISVLSTLNMAFV